MKCLRIELITQTLLEIFEQDFFKLELNIDGTPLEISACTRVFHDNAIIPAQEALINTAPANVHDLCGVSVKLYTNRILDQAELKSNFSLRLSYGPYHCMLPLSRPDIAIYWEERGIFVIPLIRLP